MREDFEQKEDVLRNHGEIAQNRSTPTTVAPGSSTPSSLSPLAPDEQQRSPETCIAAPGDAKPGQKVAPGSPSTADWGSPVPERGAGPAAQAGASATSQAETGTDSALATSEIARTLGDGRRLRKRARSSAAAEAAKAGAAVPKKQPPPLLVMPEVDVPIRMATILPTVAVEAPQPESSSAVASASLHAAAPSPTAPHVQPQRPLATGVPQLGCRVERTARARLEDWTTGGSRIV